MKQAIFAAGCFWGVEAAYRQLDGVTDVEVGYMGGNTPEPDYHLVCTGQTGHAEVVRVSYDETLINYEQLLQKFWLVHDATQLNRQGPDVGTQYRSAIYFYDEEQMTLASHAMQEQLAAGVDVVTTLEAAGPFWRAEEYHQQYLNKRGLAICAS